MLPPHEQRKRRASSYQFSAGDIPERDSLRAIHEAAFAGLRPARTGQG